MERMSFFLAPYHPAVYDIIKYKFPMVIKSEQVVREFAFKNSIPVYGSFDPEIIGLEKSCFYDGLHVKESGLKKILKPQNIL